MENFRPQVVPPGYFILPVDPLVSSVNIVTTVGAPGQLPESGYLLGSTNNVVSNGHGNTLVPRGLSGSYSFFDALYDPVNYSDIPLGFNLVNFVPAGAEVQGQYLGITPLPVRISRDQVRCDN